MDEVKSRLLKVAEELAAASELRLEHTTAEIAELEEQLRQLREQRELWPDERLIGLEAGCVLHRESLILCTLRENAVADDEGLHLGTHKTSERIFRCADDRLPTHVEARIDEHGAAGAALEFA
jgi:hypothetical protein